MDKWERLQHLVKVWLAHVHDTPGHKLPLTEGGSATYDTSPSSYRVYCSCGWRYELEQPDDCPS